MIRPLRLVLAFVVLGLGWGLPAADLVALVKKPEVKAPELPDLSEFRTVETAITTRISNASPAVAGQSGYLGIHVTPVSGNKLQIVHVEADSPAAKAGLQAGDLLLKFAGEKVGSVDALREQLQSHSPGDTVELSVVRKKQSLQISATLAATSRPMKVGKQRAILGVQIGEPKTGEGVRIEQVTSGSAAATAGVKTGDVLVKINDAAVKGPSHYSDLMADRKPAETVTLTLLRDGKNLEVKAKLDGASEGGGKRGGWDSRTMTAWKKDLYRLAIVCIEYPDVKHNAKITDKDWENALFSRKSYTKTSVTGQKVHGSLNDYYQEQSFGALKVEGKCFPFVQVSKKRGDYSQGTGTGTKAALLTEALDKLLARDGKDALKNFDGIFFLYAGERFKTNRGGLYWPHRASVSHQGKRWPYFICPEGGSRMGDISVICHEFGHMLGLPDLYARPEQPGSEGLGVWCAMSNQIGNGRPQHFCAWSKEQLGWIKPAVIDPTTKQKLILSPVEDSSKQVFKVLVKPDGSEYLLLENRRKKGFDSELPAEGLLIWRVVNNKPVLEESHGVEGPAGPRVFLSAVPYPSTANNAFTPYTTPSSRSQLGGGLPVYITNIRRLPDGRITFFVGYEYL
jgi:M6 family metalloprotease-like protein